ncbi:MAG: type II toxin-antitoxin system RelE/ParE family toxin [Curvibacter lanceolatus]|uniref:type II toxin-antitoxin system RelE/ParE family toxin n=1 Tax=Curvibacter lanceolatus TaxID=86182 RepID=UPI000A000890|nr:type II toxin-antitoxin system RelE/ParE family toxin [Curvibacter lanceolatus]MBV5291600.1 type II toxin-antitoxin system RelE/ParE family toxin [Curvibacter lanceolatus]
MSYGRKYSATKWHTVPQHRVFITRHFARWMRKTALTHVALCAAVEEMVAGLIDAELGGHILKKRVALPGRGKQGSTRTLVATRQGSHWFYLFGFEKNERANVTPTELQALQLLAASLLSLNDTELETAVADGTLQEIGHEATPSSLPAKKPDSCSSP